MQLKEGVESKPSLIPGRRQQLLLGLVVLLLFTLESVAVHNIYTSIAPGGNDFYPRWAGARALLIEGRDPYSAEVTRETEAVLDPQQRRTNSFNFAFPLPVIFLFWPLVYGSYAWAQAIWMVTLQWVAIGLVVTLVVWRQQRPSPFLITLTILAVLSFYPVVRTIFLGQFTLHVALFVALTLLLLQRGRDGWAGLCLSLAVVKPQMVLLLVPWLLIWAAGQRRWRFLIGLAGGGAGLLLVSLALVPDWPLGFLTGLRDYKAVAAGRDPLQVLLDLLWPAEPVAVRYAAVILLVLLLLAAWRRGWRHDGPRFERAVFWTITVSLLAFFQTGTTNQVLLLIPLFVWGYQLRDRLGRWPVVLTAVVLLPGLWFLFTQTLRGNAESELMFLPLPFLAFFTLWFQELAEWRAGWGVTAVKPDVFPPETSS